jgi:beta-galactosidase
MYFGAAYYPEHWPEQRWDIDIEMMEKANFNIVRLAEFAWSKMERNEGDFDFRWLEVVIQKLKARGIKVILGTPTAAPPKWLIDKHPDIPMLDDKGHVRGFGSRRYYCFNNKNYHKHVKRIVEKMADHFGNNDNVVAWQIDNEFGCGSTTRCYCDNCRREFQEWLKQRYGSIDNLNESWGAMFSSQVYNSFEEVILPLNTAMYLHNPSLLLDYRRFSSDSVAKFQKLQTDILREKVKDQIITTNLMGAFNEIDYFNLSKDLDICSLDTYPNIIGNKEAPSAQPAFAHDVTRGIMSKNYWVMEHQSGAPGGDIMFKTPKPGELRKWTYQSIAHGADGILYFRWRTCTFSVEEYWHGILGHDGKPNRRLEEATRTGEELKRIGGVFEDSRSGAKAAIVRSYDNEWVFEIQPHKAGYKYIDHMFKYYNFFHKHNIPVDIISPDSDLSEYSLVILPNLIMSNEETINKLYEFVANGGRVVLDYRAGAKQWDNRMLPETLPCKFTELLGIEISDYGIITEDEPVDVRYLKNDKLHSANIWYDVISLKGAEALAEYNNDYFAGVPAITVNKYGKGRAYYNGTEVEEEFMDVLLKDIADESGVEPVLKNMPNGVEAVQRIKDGMIYIFVINYNSAGERLKLSDRYIDIISGNEFVGTIDIEPNGVYIFKLLV